MIYCLLIFIRAQFNLTFINPPCEVVDDGDEDIEDRIINTFAPVEDEDPATEPPPTPPVPHQEAVDALEKLLLYYLQTDRNTRPLEEMMQREKRRIEGYLYEEKGKKTQRRITDFLDQC